MAHWTQTSADVSQCGRHGLLRQLLDELPELVPLGSHGLRPRDQLRHDPSQTTAGSGGTHAATTEHR